MDAIGRLRAAGGARAASSAKSVRARAPPTPSPVRRARNRQPLQLCAPPRRPVQGGGPWGAGRGVGWGGGGGGGGWDGRGGPPRADPPDAFLDPITAALMADPVILPSSRKTVDRATLERLLLAPDAADPFTRAPLSRDGVVADAELSARIRAWREGEGGGGGGALAMEE